MLEEHGHVDTVGGEADEEEDGDEDGELDPVKEELRLTTDHVFGVVPRDDHVHVKDEQLSGTLLADRLTSSGTAVHDDAVSACVTVTSDSMIVVEDI